MKVEIGLDLVVEVLNHLHLVLLHLQILGKAKNASQSPRSPKELRNSEINQKVHLHLHLH